MGALQERGAVIKGGHSQRSLGQRLVLLAVLVLVVGLFALLAWGMVRSGGRPGGLGINTKLGEVKIQQGPARPFELSLFDGGKLSLEDLRGKVVMVDFWASWCPPCRQEARELARVYREYQGKEVEFVGVDIWDSEEGAKEFIARYGVTYPNGLDAKGKIAIDYGVSGIPEKFFINRDGVLLKKFIGPMDSEKLRQVLEELLQSK